MRVLLDSCTLSEIQYPKPNQGVVQFLTAVGDSDMYLSVLTIGEIARGVHLLAPGKKRDRLQAWLHAVIQQYGHRILPVDLEITQLWARLGAQSQRSGRQVAAVDGLIAATALAHGLTVVTRDIKDFEPTGVMVHNPWTD